jgi:hypothetical protein
MIEFMFEGLIFMAATYDEEFWWCDDEDLAIQ